MNDALVFDSHLKFDARGTSEANLPQNRKRGKGQSASLPCKNLAACAVTEVFLVDKAKKAA